MLPTKRELGKRGGRAGSNRSDDADAEMNPQVNTGASSFGDDCGSNPVEATNEPARESGSLQWGPVREMMPSAYRVRRELYPAGQTREDSFEEFKKRLLDAYGTEESTGQLYERFHALHQREGQTIEGGGVSERDLVARFAGGITSKEAYLAIRLQEPATLTEARRLVSKVMRAEEDFHQRRQTRTGNPKPEKTEATQPMEDLIREGHFLRDCPQRRVAARVMPATTSRRPAERTTATINPQTGNVLTVPGRIENMEISLFVDSGAVVSVIPKQVWDKATSCRKLRGPASPIQLGDGRKMATFGWGSFSCTWGDGRGRSRSHYMVLRDGTRVKFQQEACSDSPPSIGCMGTGVPQKGTRQVTTDSAHKTTAVPPPSGPAVCHGRLVGQMLESGMIEPASGPWSSPVVLVRKKDGSPRFCVDYRRLNAVTRVDAQLLPRIDDTLDALAGSLDDDCMAVVQYTGPGFRVLAVQGDAIQPMQRPGDLQRLMENALMRLTFNGCLVYLDDIIVYGRTEEEHLERLAKVLHRLQSVGLKIRPDKCQLMRRSLRYRNTARKSSSSWASLRIIGADKERPEVELGARTGGSLDQAEECPVQPANFVLPFLLDVDASEDALGAVLSQPNHHGLPVVVADASRSLLQPERKYCATRREMLALVWATRHFRPYLYGRKITARTDHNALRWLRNFGEPEGQEWLEKRDWPQEPPPGSQMFRSLWSQRDRLTLRDGILCLAWEATDREEEKVLQVVPRRNIPEVLRAVHNHPTGGHLGVAKTLGRVRQRFYWPQQREDVEDWCRACQTCAARAAPMQIHSVGQPFQRVGMDLVRPLEGTRRGNRYILVVCNYFSKWPEAFPLPDAEVATALIFGIAKTRTCWPELKLVTGRPRHPQSQGAVERLNGVLQDKLAIWMRENGCKRWSMGLKFVQWQINVSIHETTGQSPFKVTFGEQPRIGLESYVLPKSLVAAAKTEEEI
ncbi:Retrovirus-related Pol polyprotein from transposon [Trichinella sp. T8]|nr:Retrovirus-related Pol polyprotein from transposon [Trichinella sp. T8]